MRDLIGFFTYIALIPLKTTLTNEKIWIGRGSAFILTSREMKTCQALMVSRLDFSWCRQGRAWFISKTPNTPQCFRWIRSYPCDVPFNLTAPDGSKQAFWPANGLEIHENSSASQVYYAAITPGAVLEEEVLPVVDGQFTYKFDPKKMADKIKTYDIINLVKAIRRWNG